MVLVSDVAAHQLIRLVGSTRKRLLEKFIYLLGVEVDIVLLGHEVEFNPPVANVLSLLFVHGLLAKKFSLEEDSSLA